MITVFVSGYAANNAFALSSRVNCLFALCLCIPVCESFRSYGFFPALYSSSTSAVVVLVVILGYKICFEDRCARRELKLSIWKLPKETVGRVRAVLIEMLTNDNKKNNEKENDDIKDGDIEDDNREDDNTEDD